MPKIGSFSIVIRDDTYGMSCLCLMARLFVIPGHISFSPSQSRPFGKPNILDLGYPEIGENGKRSGLLSAPEGLSLLKWCCEADSVFL